MEALKFERTKVSLEIYGEKLEVFRPTKAQHRMVLERVSTTEDPIEVEKAWSEFLVNLGIPQAIVENLEVSHMRDLIDHMCGVKKN